MKYGFRIKTIAALLLLVTAGCTTEQINQLDVAQRAIVFTPSVGNAQAKADVPTRAASGSLIESNDNIPLGGSFGVYAYSKINAGSSVTPFTALQNMQVTKGGSSFTYSPVANWPGQSGAQLAFYAYYPWQAADATPAAGEPVIQVTTGAAGSPSMTINYSCPADPTKQVDLMYAYAGLSTGYDPVQLAFGHALTRINFEACKKNYSEEVKITKITLKNVLSQGVFTVLNASVPVWTSLTTTTDMSLTTANGLLTSSLGTTLASVLTTGGDLLVIPQKVEGLLVEVEATVGGNPINKLVYALDNSADWSMNQITTYQLTFTESGMTVTTKVNDWNGNGVNIIEDGQWRLTVTDDLLKIGSEGGTVSLVAETNYDTDEFGYPVGLQFNSADVVYTSGGKGWLSINITGADGDLSRTLTFTASNSQGVRYQTSGYPVERSATLRLKAGNLTKVINIVQEKFLISPEFARSNIVLYKDNNGNSILTFAETATDHMGKIVTPKAGGTYTFPAIPANVQGIHFRWGGLVGLSSTCTAKETTNFDGLNDVKFWPEEYEATCIANNSGKTPDEVEWKFNQTDPWTDPDQIPYLGDLTVSNTTTTHDAFKGKYTVLGYDATNAYGDICRYMSDKGWVEGNWRMPTRRELELLDNETKAVGEFNAGNGNMQYGIMFGTYSSSTNWTYVAMNNPISAGSPYYGFTYVPNARMVGGGITIDDVGDLSYLSTGGESRIVLPASGNRHFHNGIMYNPGFNGGYWGCTPGGTSSGNTNAGFLHIAGGTFNVYASNSRSYGFSVRCVRVGPSE